jgi:hypothetical protein
MGTAAQAITEMIIEIALEVNNPETFPGETCFSGYIEPHLFAPPKGILTTACRGQTTSTKLLTLFPI